MRDKERNWKAKHPSYMTWCDIKQRCFNPNHKSYKYYGERGIGICDTWLDYKAFEKWLMAHDWQHGMTIDRIDNNGNYCPENCQVLTRSENSKKKTLDNQLGMC